MNRAIGPKAWRLLLLTSVVLLSLGATAALAGQLPIAIPTFQSPPPPPNDNFADATVIGALPFDDTVDLTYASTQDNEPQNCNWSPQTVWYSFTPTQTMWVRVTGSGLSDTNLVIHQAYGPGITDLSFIGCSSWYNASVEFQANVGTTYYFQTGKIYAGAGTLQINVQQVPPPDNDYFKNSILVSSLPFNYNVDARAATLENGEPLPDCAQGYGAGATIWYAFTPVETQKLTAYASGSDPFEAVYTGSALNGLQQLACRRSGGNMTFLAQGGVTHYFQVGNLNNQGSWLYFELYVTPPLTVYFYYWPNDPSEYDTVQFNAYCYDPVGEQFTQQVWDLGDGTTADGCCPIHRYAREGDYTATLTCTTKDGRSATSTQTIAVRTHDVAITKLAAPQAAASGQTRQLSVEVKNKRVGENVQVELYKSVPNGYEQVGRLTQFVPVRSGNRTTTFAFSYTFTPADAAVGKVTFKAVASILNARDALPADNEAIASPTKVSR
jgi:hypothetical protein